ncbi:hypothetical protein EJ04DRAFT_496573 [Polyplosphaeria fusca]|uniref:Uncharacterized protein n=1 Tax=Polyplosphaeria fusca TaxID=682080 RepID=A0A9P4QXC7_9PLEO|nr:hypothetical protein EJ04DRAFT_496573 [Polyplosphaeria fusca]
MASLLEEDFYTSATSMREPDTARKGSTTGWICTQEIMCGIDDVRCVRPQLAFFKVHEVKELKNWLAGHRYLERSDGISRVEKLLHLIFLLQDGVRFEVIAVLFSRSPNTVKRSCLEVFNGLLEMHSETMVPEDPPLYCHLWRITDQYATADRCMSAYRYYPWDAHDLSKVLTTMNFYIGRYRKQAKLALDGPFMDWGRYLRGSSRYLQGSSSSSNNGV